MRISDWSSDVCSSDRKRSYLIQYRSGGRSSRYTIGTHGIWTPEAARREAKMQLARVAQGEDPAEDRAELNKAMSMKELCELYMKDLRDGLILGKGEIGRASCRERVCQYV